MSLIVTRTALLLLPSWGLLFSSWRRLLWGLGLAGLLVPAFSGPAAADYTLKANQAILFGTILDVVRLPPLQPGLSPAKEWLRLIIQVEKTREVQGYANYLQGKEGEPMTFFTDRGSPLFLPGKRVKGLIEYRGDKNSRFFWISKPEAISPER